MSFLISLLAIGVAGSVLSPEPDIADTLAPAGVSAEKVFIASAKDTISFKNHLSIPDAIHSVPGLQLSDAGGYSGLKTVSIRGLGSSQTNIYVDGIKVTNVQSGQTDLGMFDLEGFDSAVVDYSTNSLSFTTPRPRVNGGAVSLKGGSFGTWLPRGEYDWVINENNALRASVSGIISMGDFPYADSLRRSGNDIKKIQAGLDYFTGNLHLKAYLNRSDRGTPGSASWPSDDRQKDANYMLQGSWHRKFGNLYSVRAQAKYSFDNLQYNTSYGDSRYKQSVLLADIQNNFEISKWFDIFLNLQLENDALRSDFSADRFTVKPSLGVSADTKKIRASFYLEYMLAKDKGYKARNIVSPSLQLKYNPLKGLSVTAFGRRAYRIPTFNELYYTGFGNPELKAEDAWLSDVGVMYDRLYGAFRYRGGVNVFYNYLRNKITSAPTEEDPNIWLPYNIGEVGIFGSDLEAGVSYTETDWSLGVSAKYSYMNALDKTLDSYSFNQQIAYVPKHTASIAADGMWKHTSASLVWNIKAGRKDSYGDMPDWNTLDLTVKQEIGKHIEIALYGRNITNQKYEMSTGYPMPGISLLGGIEICF